MPTLNNVDVTQRPELYFSFFHIKNEPRNYLVATCGRRQLFGHIRVL